MKIHEYQAKELLRRSGVAVPRGGVAFTAEEAQRIAEEIGEDRVVIKAQIHAGGRGKGGGVRVVPRAEAGKTAAEMIGMTLVTHQTGPEGKIVRKVLVEQALEIARELYAGIVLDRARGALVFMASTEGGVEIEKVAAESPEKIFKEYLDRAFGLQSFQARKLAFGLGLRGEQAKSAIRFFIALASAYLTYDCSLAEINPLVVTSDGQVLALDAKINLDDNALYRHPELAAFRDVDEEDPLEVEAAKYDLNYIRLDGSVGCMVNGAGLAMATMDIIKLAGAEPANFLDVGGGASAETVENGFRILLSDKNVKAVLINIFGGIVRCDRVARGVIEAAQKVDMKVPLVVRLEGTNAKEAAELLKASGLSFAVATSFAQAAQKVVEVMRA
ncbi:MAG: ADP-forming succinate--CoA ligase subunit beta [Candidatus Oleimicrobiaceae bacterium]